MRNNNQITHRCRRSPWNSVGCLLAAASVLATIANYATASSIKSNPASTRFVTLSRSDKPNAAVEVAIGNPLWAVPLKELAATRDRPLFAPTRRPPPPPMASVSPPRPVLPVKPEKPPLALIGTIIGDGEVIGVFRDETAKRVVSLRSGERRYGWLLDRVHKRDVVLQKDNSNVFLALSPEATAPVTVAMQQPEPRLVRRQH